MSFSSWGEELEIKIEQITPDRCLINLSSKPILSTTLVDYGKNKRNIKKLVQIFNKQ